MKTPYNFVFYHADLGFVECEVTFMFDKQIEVWISGLDPTDKHNMLPIEEFEFYEENRELKAIYVFGQSLTKNMLFCIKSEKFDLSILKENIDRAKKDWDYDSIEYKGQFSGLYSLRF